MPYDEPTLNASTNSHGLLPRIPGDSTGYVHPVGVLAEQKLTASAPNVTFSGLDLSLVPKLKIYGSFRIPGTGTGFGYDHVRMQLNNDSTIAHYMWSVLNTNVFVQSNSGAAADPAQSTGDLSSASLMIAHAASSATPAAQYGTSHITIPFPGASDRNKTLISHWTFVDNVASPSNNYGTVGQGYWASTAPITSIKLFPQIDANFAAGTHVVLFSE